MFSASSKALTAEIDTTLEIGEPNPHLNMVTALLKSAFQRQDRDRHPR